MSRIWYYLYLSIRNRTMMYAGRKLHSHARMRSGSEPVNLIAQSGPDPTHEQSGTYGHTSNPNVQNVLSGH